MTQRKVTSFRISDYTAEQVAQLRTKLSTDITETIMLAIDRMYRAEFPERKNPMSSQTCTCRVCGADVAAWPIVKANVQRDYSYTDQELDSGRVVVKIAHPDCAVSDKWIDSTDDLNGDTFAYKIIPQN